jgi:hypothetical protein
MRSCAARSREGQRVVHARRAPGPGGILAEPTPSDTGATYTLIVAETGKSDQSILRTRWAGTEILKESLP